MVALVTNANAFSFGLAKQSSGTAVAGTAAYSLPVYSSSLTPTYDLQFVEVTDAASIQGDPYKGPTSWSGDVESPMLAASLGALLQTMWPADALSGTATPYTHTFSGVGGTQSFVTFFDQFTNAGTAAVMRFGNGLVTELEFSADSGGGPARIRASATGASVANLAWTATTADAVSNGYFTLQSATASVKQDPDTPNSTPSTSITNVRDVSVTVTRPATAEPTVDSVSVNNMSQGKQSFGGSMTMLYNTWDEHLASFFGAAAGASAASSTIVYGALQLNFAHSVQATWTFSLYIPKVQFYVPRPTPDPAGGPLVQNVTLNVADPSSGDHVQPILINGVSTDYDA